MKHLEMHALAACRQAQHAGLRSEQHLKTRRKLAKCGLASTVLWIWIPFSPHQSPQELPSPSLSSKQLPVCRKLVSVGVDGKSTGHPLQNTCHT